MKARWSLWVAAAMLAVIGLGHTLLGMLMPEDHGPVERGLFEAMGRFHFDMMGSQRSHMDFYTGEGWYLSLAAFAMSALLALLATGVDEHPRFVRRLLLVPLAFSAGSTALSVRYFFIAPLASSVIATLACVVAWVQLRGHERA